MDELAFHFQHVVLDFSDFHNADSMVFPTNYPDTYSGERKTSGGAICSGPKYIFHRSSTTIKANLCPLCRGHSLDDYGLTGLLVHAIF